MKKTQSQTLDARFEHLNTRQRAYIASTITKNLAKYGGLPGLSKREKERSVNSLAMKYGVPRTVIVDIYERSVTAKVERDRLAHEYRMGKLRAEGKTDHAFGKDVPDTKHGNGHTVSRTLFGKKGKKK